MKQEGWIAFKLGELADITSSKRIFLSDYVEVGIPFYRSKEIIEKANGGDISTELFITKERYSAIKQKFGSPVNGDLLLAAVGERAGTPYCVKDDGDFYFKDGNLIWFRNFNKTAHSKFLYYYFRTKVGQLELESTMIGSAQKALTIIGLKNLEVNLPLFNSQVKIASVLSSLDDKIELNLQMNKTLGAIAQAIFKEWFVDFRFPGFDGELMDGLPKGWRKRKLGVLVRFTKGVSYRSIDLNPSNKALVTLKSIRRGGGFNSDGFKEYNGLYKETQVLSEGDIILAQTDITQNAEVIGSPAIVENPNSYSQLIASIDIIKCEPVDGLLKSSVLYFFLQNQDFKNYCLSYTNGSTVLHLKSSCLPNYEIILPGHEILDFFTEIASNILNKISANTKEIRTLINLRDILLPKLMTGKIKV
jgi:type I restriction enzyme, S subunit